MIFVRNYNAIFGDKRFFLLLDLALLEAAKPEVVQDTVSRLDKICNNIWKSILQIMGMYH